MIYLILFYYHFVLITIIGIPSCDAAFSDDDILTEKL